MDDFMTMLAGKLNDQLAGITESEEEAEAPAKRELPPSDGGARFVSYLESRYAQIEGAIMRTLPQPIDADARIASDLTRYLYEPMARFTVSGGKRTRPALCLLGAEAIGADPICALSTAVAIENFQTAALIHDDIADGSVLRRGEPCLHLTEGVGPAINTGDLALVTVLSGLLEDSQLNDQACLRVLCEIAYMEQRTLEGQALDLCWVRDKRWDLTADDYAYMATHKTAFYSAATPLACGAICANGTDEQVEALRAFGMDAGLAFQLQDDLLNIVGDAEAQGKDCRSDITEGKRTMAAVTALERLEGAEHDELLAILSAKTTDAAQLARAVELMEACGAIEAVCTRALELVESGKEHLREAEFDPEALATLVSMADFFVKRVS